MSRIKTIKLTHFEPKETIFSLVNTKEYPIMQTVIYVGIEYDKKPYKIVFSKPYHSDYWSIETVYIKKESFYAEEVFSPHEIDLIYEYIMYKLHKELEKVKEQEKEYLYDYLGIDPQDALIKLGMSLTEKIAIEGKWRVGFALTKDNRFMFILIDYLTPDGFPVLIVGLNEIWMRFHSEDAFVESAVLAMNGIIEQIGMNHP